ncbi:hypothetical protein [Paraburkholderia bryophila]|jgi:hypothetical protein|uniref:Response regulatory domain-containing protein n=1 Tax=Paraburkholderia bryophila TaxID=420952 RepID=A0A329BKB3_9BURK|nr:hypothetical protein BX591_14234 [Paraburkholderia bryophila]
MTYLAQAVCLGDVERGTGAKCVGVRPPPEPCWSRTAYGQATDRERSHEAGFDHRLVKPVSSEEIRQVSAARFPGGRREA